MMKLISIFLKRLKQQKPNHDSVNLVSQVLDYYNFKDTDEFWQSNKQKDETLEECKLRIYRSYRAIDPFIKLKQEGELVLLESLIHYAEQYNLTYWATYGTLLGAHRHRNFIPWDDDIDLMMPMNDIMRLKEILKDNDELMINEFYLPRLGAKLHRLMFKKYPKIWFIDLYANMPTSLNLLSAESIYKKHMNELIKDLSIHEVGGYGYLNEYSRKDQKLLQQIYDLHYQKFSEELKNDVKQENKGYVFCLGTPINSNGAINYAKYEDVFPFKPILFASLTINVPNNYLEYLKDFYKNYLSIPKDLNVRLHNDDYITNPALIDRRRKILLKLKNALKINEKVEL